MLRDSISIVLDEMWYRSAKLQGQMPIASSVLPLLTPISAIYKFQTVNVKEKLGRVFFGIVSDTNDTPPATH